MERLDRLTQDEVRTTAAHTLAIVHRLVQNMKEFMDGEQLNSVCNPVSLEYSFL